jgi:CRISPR-associated protein Cmr5
MTQQRSKAPRRQTIEQERGRQAWKDIQSVKSIAKDYRPIARGLTAMIQINGLGQTLGFFYAKSRDEKGNPDPKKAHYQVLSHLTSWMREHFTPGANKIGKGYSALLFWVIEKDTSSSDLRRATTECLAYGRWLARFAEAELAENTNPSDGATGGTGNG